MVQGEQLLGQVEMSELRVAEDDMVQAKVGRVYCDSGETWHNYNWHELLTG